jgi:hypothetical protein
VDALQSISEPPALAPGANGEDLGEDGDRRHATIS